MNANDIIDEAFDEFASQFDHESNEWLDMDVQRIFASGWKAALKSSLPAESEVELAAQDASLGGTAFMQDGKRIDPAEVYSLPDETVSDAMVESLRNIRRAIVEDTTALNDTLWMPDDVPGGKGASVIDYIDQTLEAAALAAADDGWRSEDMPPPDRVIHYNDGMSAPAMFHYSTEGCDSRAIAREAGFEIAFVTMESELDEDHPLMKAYVDDGEMSSVLNRWKPAVPYGWKLGGKSDSEDGPVALLLRPLPAPPTDGRE